MPKPSGCCDRVVDVMEELVRFPLLARPHAAGRKGAGTRADAAADADPIALARRKRSA